jgi:hypothetical protein
MSSNRLNQKYKYNLSEFNDRKYDKNDIGKVYSTNFNEKYSIINEPNIEYEEKVHYLTVSSKDRNLDYSPLVNNYTVHFPSEFKNIYSIELIQAIIPAKNNADGEPYLLLDIGEIADVMVSSDSNIANAFAILLLAPPNTPGGFIQIDNRIHENTVLDFTTPKASLSKMTISIKDSDGNLFDFGVNSNTLNKSMQNTFIFKIVVGQKKRAQLDQRNVY